MLLVIVTARATHAGNRARRRTEWTPLGPLAGDAKPGLRRGATRKHGQREAKCGTRKPFPSGQAIATDKNWCDNSPSQ